MAFSSQRLKEVRKSRSITQKAMAEYLSITEQAYQRIEYGKFAPRNDTLAKICECLQVSADWLLCLSEVQSINSSTPTPDTMLKAAANESESGDPWEKVFAILKTMARDIARDIAETNARIDRLYDNSSVTSPATEDEEAVALEMSL